jgi:uncharacterized protein YndB with AHSA1/START domain
MTTGRHVGPASMQSSRVSRIIKAPREAVYRACIEPGAVAAWRVPDNMTAHVHAFDARVGGGYRMSLTYRNVAQSPGGKSSYDTDTFEGQFVELVANEKIVEVIAFESEDPGFSGEMTITTTFRDAADGTEITMAFENIPPGVRPADNDEGTRQSLNKLAALLEADPVR